MALLCQKGYRLQGTCWMLELSLLFQQKHSYQDVSAKKLSHIEKAFENSHFCLELLSICNLPLRGGFEM